MTLTQANIQDAFLRAGALQQAGRLTEAEVLWREITAAAPSSAESHANLGTVLLLLDDIAGAEAAYRSAARLAPTAHFARYHLARLLGVTGRLAEAEAEMSAALALKPGDARTELDLGYLKLARADASGWALYDRRVDVPGQQAQRLALPGEWQGEPLAGKSLLVWPEQGFGDQIQFVRFLPRLAAHGCDVTLAAPRELSALFAELPVRVVEQGPSLAMAPPDHWTLLLSTPRWLGAGFDDLWRGPYLSAPPERRARWQGFAPPRAVGIAWKGRSTHPNDRHRSLPQGLLAATLERAGGTVVDLSEPLGDFADLAAVIAQLDLVVCVDTAVAHLAGAMGKPCWILLPWLATDWRWGRDRDDSPWYPTARLFRQPALGDWSSVLQAVETAYREFRTA